MSHRRVSGRGRYGKEYGNSLVQRRNDKEDKRAASPKELIRRCQKIPYSNLYKIYSVLLRIFDSTSIYI